MTTIYICALFNKNDYTKLAESWAADRSSWKAFSDKCCNILNENGLDVQSSGLEIENSYPPISWQEIQNKVQAFLVIGQENISFYNNVATNRSKLFNELDPITEYVYLVFKVTGNNNYYVPPIPSVENLSTLLNEENLTLCACLTADDFLKIIRGELASNAVVEEIKEGLNKLGITVNNIAFIDFSQESANLRLEQIEAYWINFKETGKSLYLSGNPKDKQAVHDNVIKKNGKYVYYIFHLSYFSDFNIYQINQKLSNTSKESVMREPVTKQRSAVKVIVRFLIKWLKRIVKLLDS